MLDNKVMKMTPGEALLEVPVGDFIQKLGISIAEAQIRLDQMAIRVAAMLSDARVELRDSNGKVTSKSLLELGFTPTFYHFTETEIEVRMTISMKVEESFTFGLSANVGNDPDSIAAAAGGAAAGAAAAEGGGQGGAPADGPAPAPAPAQPPPDRRAVAFGAAINVEYHRKYGFEMSGSSMVRTKMIAVPPPGPFMDALREQARAGGSIGVGSSNAPVPPAPDATPPPSPPASGGDVPADDDPPANP